MEDKERIRKEADDYSFQVPYDGTKVFNNNDKFEGYIAGATSEHPKAWNAAIDACIKFISENDSFIKSELEELKK